MIGNLMRALGLSVLASLGAGSVAACGTAQTLCEIDSGAYRVALPDDVSPDTPVLLFLHGYGGSSKGTMGNRRLVALDAQLPLDVALEWQVSRVLAPAMAPVTAAVRKAAKSGLIAPET